MSANAKTAAPTGRKKLAQGKERSDAVLGHNSPNTSSPVGAKEGGELPDGWQRKTLGESCDILAGFGFPEHLQGKTGGELPFFKVGDISESWKRGEVHLTKANHYLSHAEASGIRARPLPKNTTVFAKIGAAIALNRRAILSEPALVDNNVMGLHPATEALDHKFLFHFICTVKLDELSRATTVPSVRKSDIEQIEFPLPPLPEQRRIVSEIEKQFTRLEAGVAALRRVQANLKRYRAAVLKAACEGKLVPTEHELSKSEVRIKKDEAKSPKSRASTSSFLTPTSSFYESGEALLQRILAERRKNWTGRGQYKEPAAPDTANLPPLPKGWTWATVEQLLRDDSGLSYGILKPGVEDPNGVPMVRVMDIADGRMSGTEIVKVSPELSEEFRRTILEKGDILLAVMATVGRCTVVPDHLIGANVNRALAVIKPTALALNEFLALAIRSPRLQHLFQKNKIGSAQARINLTELRTYVLPIPPLAEQTRIVAEVERRLSVVEELESVVSANLQRATRLRQSILQKAFTGKLT